MLGPGVKATQHAQAAGDDAEQVIDHPALTLLDRPNPVLAGHDYTWLQEVFLSLTGTAFDSLILERGGGVRELWWLFPQWVSIQPDQDELIGGYWYGRDASNRTWLDRDEVLYMRQPSPFDPYYGMGPLAACLSAVDRYNALDRQMFKRSKRDANPDMLVRTRADSWPTQVQVDQILEQFRSEEHTSELQSREKLVCRLLLEKKKQHVQSPSEGEKGP